MTVVPSDAPPSRFDGAQFAGLLVIVSYKELGLPIETNMHIYL